MSVSSVLRDLAAAMGGASWAVVVVIFTVLFAERPLEIDGAIKVERKKKERNKEGIIKNGFFN